MNSQPHPPSHYYRCRKGARWARAHWQFHKLFLKKQHSLTSPILRLESLTWLFMCLQLVFDDVLHVHYIYLRKLWLRLPPFPIFYSIITRSFLYSFENRSFQLDLCLEPIGKGTFLFLFSFSLWFFPFLRISFGLSYCLNLPLPDTSNTITLSAWLRFIIWVGWIILLFWLWLIYYKCFCSTI